MHKINSNDNDKLSGWKWRQVLGTASLGYYGHGWVHQAAFSSVAGGRRARKLEVNV